MSPVLAGIFLLLCRAPALAESPADQTPSSLSEGDRVVEQIVERIDDAEDANLDDRWEKLIRRSYSI